ncbi:uncharacterized protein yc1106_09443 [Curvularia clavata]|uniref:Chromo domain-containing protein n=1 Tax=Curvularia clavata TaxID=95742 RepID=A0A9Q8ZGD2_CURCL|nr:uncharacterized protein yc1106_09443 [Curvularia clavata]
MYFTNFVPSKHDGNVPVRSFVLYDPNLQRKPRKRKTRSDEDKPKSSEKQSTDNVAGPKSSSVPSIQTPEPATQTSELSSESVDNEEIQDTEEISNQLRADVCTSDFPRNREDEDIVSSNTTTLDVDNRHGDAANSVDNIEELSEPVAISISPSNSVNRDVTSESVATEHDEIHDSIDVAGSPRRISEPLSDDEEDQHEVEKIVGHRQRGGLTEYLTMWAGWPGSRNTWEPARNFKGCPGLVQEYSESLKNCNSTSSDTDTRDPSNTRSDEMSESDGDRYEIQKIVGHVEYNGWLRYDVEWSGGERTCEPASNLDQCRETVEEYWKELSSTNKATSIGDRRSPFSDQLQGGEVSDYANLRLTSKEMRRKCSMERNERHTLFSQFLVEEAWEFDHASQWMYDHAIKKPTSTIILFESVLPQRPREASALGAKLAFALAGNNQEKNAIEIMEIIWRYRTKGGYTHRDVVGPALQLAALYEQSGRPEDAIEILETIWRVQTQLSMIRSDVVALAVQVAALYEQSGRPEDAIETLETIWQDQTQISMVRSDVVKLALQVAALYERSGRLVDAMEILWA